MGAFSLIVVINLLNRAMDESFDSYCLDLDTSETSGPLNEQEISDLNYVISDLKSEIETKSKLMLSNRPSLLDDTKQLLHDLTNTNEEIDRISTHVSKKLQPSFDFHANSLEKRHAKARLLHIITTGLESYLKCLTYMQKCNSLLKHDKLDQASEFYAKFREELVAFESLGLNDCAMFKQVESSFENLHATFKSHVLNRFELVMCFENKIFSIGKLDDDSNKVMKIIERTHFTDEIIKIIQENYMKTVKLISSSHSLRITEDKNMNFHFEISENSSSVKTSLEDYITLLERSSRSFLDFNLSDGSNLYAKIFANKDFGAQLVQAIIEQTLEARIPKTVSDLKKYDFEILDKCTSTLKGLAVISDQSCVGQFKENLEGKFVASLISRTLTEGRSLMLSDISETTPIKLESKEVLNKDLGNRIPSLNDDNSRLMNTALGNFPEILISSGILKFSELVTVAIEQASQLGNTKYACDLLQCSLDCINMYCSVTSSFEQVHSNGSLVPFLSAIQYNNLMYMAHQCMFYGLVCLKFREGAVCSQLGTFRATFMHFVPGLRRKAEELFQLTVSYLCGLLREILNESTFIGHLASNLLKNERIEPSKIIKPIEQSFFLLEKLLITWKPPVLSKNKYKLAISYLLDYILKFVVRYCVTLEDITTNDSQVIDKILSNVEKKCELIVTSLLEQSKNQDSNQRSEFYDNVLTEFNRLLCVKKILSTSLLDLQTEYLSPDSLLRQCISIDEIKNMIRALFQNTEVRSMVLNSIK